MKFRSVFCSSLLCWFSITTVYAVQPSLQELRQRYQKWNGTYQTLKIDEQRMLLATLADYSLYPYAQYQFFNTNIKTILPQEIKTFVTSNRNFPLSSNLMQSYVTELTRRKEWNAITSLDIDSSTISTCNFQYALWQQGQKSKALPAINTLWQLGKDLPSACDPLLAEWTKDGYRTSDMILLRIEASLKNNNIKLARYLTKLLPDSYKTIRNNLLTVYDNPRKLADFSKNVTANNFTKQVVIQSFARLARVDTDQALVLLPILVKRQNISQTEQNIMARSIANNYFQTTATDEQIKWRDQYIVKSQDPLLIDRRIRMALRENNFEDVAYWLSILKQEDAQKEEWQFWRAIVLLKDKKDKDSKIILTKLATNRGFYGMASAQMLKIPYKLDFDYKVIPNVSAKSELANLKNKYDNDPVIRRISELNHWGMVIDSNREWRFYLYSNTNKKQYAELARYAHKQSWGAHAVQATIAGKLWDNWIERLPLVYTSFYNDAISGKGISLSYSLAISRQESALDPTVQSPVGARGLMQLMPGTAKEMASKYSGIKYSSVSQLYDPKTNIQLGTYFLDYVYQLYGHNRILASAAYNAGPARVKNWLKESDGQLDAITFIDSIPFTETRNYVKSVLAYDYIYQLILQKKVTGILTEQEFKKKY